ncbi:MAG: DegV family protein [Caldilinea sp.]|nr:DegV family protein [Caldilinea sp.]MDW8439969.1 DegV family protein [Caldilineaceae bacterium]
MSKVRIVTDSNAFLPVDVIQNYKIAVVPHRLRVGGSFFEEDADFNVEELFERVHQAQRVSASRLPEVQAPDVNTFLDIFHASGEGEQIVCIHMSKELSPMWATARRAAEMLRGRYTIRVIDSQSVSFGLGLLVQKAAEAAEAGASVNEIARIVNGLIPHLYFACFSESLPYLERSASLSASQSLLGSMLGIKAMLMMEDGKLMTQEKVQTRDEVVEKLAEFVIEFASVEEMGVFEHGYGAQRDALIERLRETLPKTPIHKIPYPPSLAAYLGPNTIGVLVYEGMY